MKITQTKFTRNNMDRNEHETPSEKLKYLVLAVRSCSESWFSYNSKENVKVCF